MSKVFVYGEKEICRVEARMCKGHKLTAHLLTIPIETVVQFSDDHNVREVNKKAKVIKNIVNTALYEPEDIWVNNNGTTAVASAMYYDNKMKAWVIEDGSVLNGSHSKYAFSLAMKDRGFQKGVASVRATILSDEEMTNDIIASISTALNTSCSPSDTTLANKMGYMDGLKESLLPEYVDKIEWVENSKNTWDKGTYIKCEDFLSFLNCVDVSRYRSYDSKNGKIRISSNKVVCERVKNNEGCYDFLCPILNDIIQLHDRFSTSLTRLSSRGGRYKIKGLEIFYRKVGNKISDSSTKIKNTVFTEEEYLYKVHTGIVKIVLSSFKANLTRKNGKIEWIVPPFDLLERVEPKVWRSLETVCVPYAKNDGTQSFYSPLNRADSTWENIYNILALEVSEMLREG